jgi:Tfp pilus assembly protein PilO
MTAKMSVREQRTVLMVGVLAVIVLWVYVVYIIGPLRREAGELGANIRDAKQKLGQLEAAATSEPQLRAQVTQLEESVNALRRNMPAEEELPEIIEMLSDMASQSQVKIQTIFPQRPTETFDPKKGIPEPSVYKDVTIQIDALSGFHQLGTFLSLVESGDKPMRIASLRISTDPKETKRHHVKLLIQSYFATGAASRRTP